MEVSKKDETFFLSPITFEVEGYLFRVPRKPFEEDSHVFRDMFSLPPGDAEGDMNTDGSSVLRPLRLEGIKADSFRILLKIMLTPQYHEKIELPEDSWIAVLDLAHMWGLSGIEQLSIRELEALDVDTTLKYELARKYSIESWLRPVFETMTEREEPLTDDEVQRLGWRLASQIGRIRETRYRMYVEHLKEYIKVYQCAYCLEKVVISPPSFGFGSSGHYNSAQENACCAFALKDAIEKDAFTEYIARTRWEDIESLLQSM